MKIINEMTGVKCIGGLPSEQRALRLNSSLQNAQQEHVQQNCEI